MRFNFFIVFLLFTPSLWGQNKLVELNLYSQEIKKKSVPYHFKEIIFSQNVSDTIGKLSAKKNKEFYWIALKNNKSQTVFDFLGKQFEQDNNSTDIIMEVTKLKLSPSEVGKFSFTDTFQFACTFFALLQNEKTSLYSFQAKNQFGNFENAALVMSNYISRALITAVENFTLAFNKKGVGYPEIPNESPIEKKPIKIQVLLNQFSSPDSLPCTSGKKLQWDDFQVNKVLHKQEQIATDGSAKFILTYQLTSEETNKFLKLNIHVKAFFYKRNSWRPSKMPAEKWLQYQQGHQDLCGIFGRKLQNRLSNYTFSIGSYRSEINQVYNQINAELVDLRKQYQSETEHGNNEEQILLWQQKIKGLEETK